MSNNRLDDYVDFFSKQAASKLFDLFDQHQKDKGYDFVVKLTHSFLQRYIFVITLNALAAVPANPASDKEVEDYINKNMRKMKIDIQESIAAGYQKAISTHHGRTVEYFCHLVPVTQPINKQPC